MSLDELAKRRFDRQVDELTMLLAAKGCLQMNVDQVEDVETWRKAVRAAGRRLGVHVRTGVVRGAVWAADDRPLSSMEREVGNRMHNRIAEWIMGEQPDQSGPPDLHALS